MCLFMVIVRCCYRKQFRVSSVFYSFSSSHIFYWDKTYNMHIPKICCRIENARTDMANGYARPNCYWVRVRSPYGWYRNWRGAQIYASLYAPPKIVPVIIRDYSLTSCKKQYKRVTIFGGSNSYHSSVT